MHNVSIQILIILLYKFRFRLCWIPGILQFTFGYEFTLEDAVFLEREKVLHKTRRVNFRNINRLYIEAALLDRLPNECLYQNFKLSRNFRSIICSVIISLSEFICESSISIIKDLLKFQAIIKFKYITVCCC